MYEQEIINICDAQIDRDQFRAPTRSLCVDGTSATKKTTVLERTGQPVVKIKRMTNVFDRNTYFPSMIGYIAYGINSQNRGEPHFYDRSHLNCLEWNVLWRVMDDYVRKVGNVRPMLGDARIAALMDRYRKIFESLRESYYYRRFREQINAVAFVDSDVDRCNELRALRNQGSDQERSKWLFYTDLQNLMYRTLYPGAYIDMNWFNAPTDTVVNGVSKWLVQTLREISTTRATAAVPLMPYKLPILDHDYTLSNITTHVYRSLGRLACKKIKDPNDRTSLLDYVPSYVDVSNATNVDGTTSSYPAKDATLFFTTPPPPLTTTTTTMDVETADDNNNHIAGQLDFDDPNLFID